MNAAIALAARENADTPANSRAGGGNDGVPKKAIRDGRRVGHVAGRAGGSILSAAAAQKPIGAPAALERPSTGLHMAVANALRPEPLFRHLPGCEREGEPGCFTGLQARFGLQKQRNDPRRQAASQFVAHYPKPKDALSAKRSRASRRQASRAVRDSAASPFLLVSITPHGHITASVRDRPASSSCRTGAPAVRRGAAPWLAAPQWP